MLYKCIARGAASERDTKPCGALPLCDRKVKYRKKKVTFLAIMQTVSYTGKKEVFRTMERSAA